MKKIILIVAVALSMTGCASVQAVTTIVDVTRDGMLMAGYNGPSTLEPIQQTCQAPKPIPSIYRASGGRGRR